MAADAWTRMPLGGFVTLQRGHDLPEQERRAGSVPVLGSFGITGWHDEAKARGPGVTVGRSGASFGVVSYSPIDFWPLNTALYVVDFHGNDERFAYYFLKCFDFRRFNSGSAQPSLNRNFVHPVPVEVPPRDEQRAIAHILGTLDNKIELSHRMNGTLEVMARALFKSWFVDFDPVRAKAEGRDPRLPKRLADLFPDSFENSELGEIPRGWRVATVHELAEINARTLGAAHSLEVIDYIEISEVMHGEIGSVPRYQRGAEPSRARRRLRHGDSVLSTVRPDRGAYFLCLKPAETLIASTGFTVLSPRDSNWAFPYCVLTRPEVGEELGRLADGGAYPAIRPEAIAGLTLAMPPTAELPSSFQEIAAPLFGRTHENRSEARALAALRDTLLPKLISGELRLGGAERLTGCGHGAPIGSPS